MVAGVYQILNTKTQKRYIAGSTTADQELELYQEDLVKGYRDCPDYCASEDTHFNRILKDWILYGSESFDFSILEPTSRKRDIIAKRRLFWCRQLLPAYNCSSFFPVISGVYQILNIMTNEAYIGQSLDVYQRWNHHKYELNNKRHFNPKLQKSWIKYGKDKFTFSFLEQCLPDKVVLLSLEQYWIKRSKKLFNVWSL